MKKNKIIYWISTGVISAMMLFSAMGYFTNEDMKNAFVHLGFPSYFRIELGIAKVIGGIVLLVPMMPFKLKEFAYAGFGIVFISAIIAHLASGDAVSAAIMPVVMSVILCVSYMYYKKTSK
jgi:uncharacterized MnhB-related membrane protein